MGEADPISYAKTKYENEIIESVKALWMVWVPCQVCVSCARGGCFSSGVSGSGACAVPCASYYYPHQTWPSLQAHEKKGGGVTRERDWLKANLSSAFWLVHVLSNQARGHVPCLTRNVIRRAMPWSIYPTAAAIYAYHGSAARLTAVRVCVCACVCGRVWAVSWINGLRGRPP